MKRQFLKFPSRPVSYAPKMQSRRMRIGLLNHNIAYKSDGGDDNPDDSEELKAIKTIGTQVENFKTALGEKADATQFKTLEDQLTALQKDIATMKAEDVLNAIKAINDGNDKIWKQIVELQEEAQRTKEESEGSDKKPKELFSVKQVEEFVKATFKDGRKTHEPAKIEMKAAETMGMATFFEGGPSTVNDAFTGRVVDPTLYQRKRKKNMILDYFDIQTISVPKLIYLIKVEDGDDVGSASGDAGGADWILSSEAKPKRSFRVTTGEVEAKKIAIFGTLEDKLIKDVASVVNWLREDFMDEMREGINDGLLNNDPTVNAEAPLGVKVNAIQFTASPGYSNAYTATTTNVIDQIIAAIALMAYNKEEAGIVFVASDIFYKIQHLKDNEGRYQNSTLVYTNNVGQLFIAGVPIVWVDEEDIPGTHVMVVARDLGFKIKAYGPLVFERGLNGEDFRYDRTSYRGYQEFLSYIPENRENSVLYDTFANIKAGIEA